MKISVDRVHPNPNRNLRLNPLSDEGVSSLKESIVRNGWWDNVVVRPHPDRSGHYQLAYGHHRLAALKSLAKTDPNSFGVAEFIVREDLSDWQMYCFMVDENETQTRITPAALEENIKSGVTMLETFIKDCPTLEEYRERVPEDRIVLRKTMRTPCEESYGKTRAAVLRGDRIGKDFLVRELPGAKSKANNVLQVALDSFYSDREKAAAAQAAEATRKAAELAKARAEELRQAEALKRAEEEAEQKRLEAEQKLREAEQKEAERVAREKEASERRKQAAQARARKSQAAAEAAKREAETRKKHAEMRRKIAEEEAEKAQAEADRLRREHTELEAHAKKVSEEGISQAVLRIFPTVATMTAFAEAVKKNGIPPKYHAALAKMLRDSGEGYRKYPVIIAGWWDRESGNYERRNKESSRKYEIEKAQKRFDKTIDDFIAEQIPIIQKLCKSMQAIVEHQAAINNLVQAEILSKEATRLSAILAELDLPVTLENIA